MIPTAPIPDALWMPASMKQGRTVGDRLMSVLKIAEPLLGVDFDAGQRAYVRNQGRNGSDGMFITRDPNDTIYFPFMHKHRGKPRYNWIDGPTGIRRGYLVPEAAEDQEKKNA